MARRGLCRLTGSQLAAVDKALDTAALIGFVNQVMRWMKEAGSKLTGALSGRLSMRRRDYGKF